jgi:hypothetical protein
LKKRSFLLLWFAQLPGQIVLNADYGGIVSVIALIHSTILSIAFTLPAVPFRLLAGVSVD